MIGNNAYAFAPLLNPTNDAADVARTLREAGFSVTTLIDADRQTMLDGVAQFSARLKSSGGVGLLFFAGHGVQVAGENYLLPIGDGIADASELTEKAVSASAMVNSMAMSGNELNIIILDACRDNPLTEVTSGLSRIESSASLFVSYSTSPGAVALDGEGRNSPYAKHLTLALATPNLNLEETFKKTLKGVYQETSGQQTPWLSSSFFGDFVFRGGNANEATSALKPHSNNSQAVDEASPRTLSGLYKVTGTNPNGSRYTGMLVLEQRGAFYDFTWWIGRDVFRGKGELAGRMLVVNWNDVLPVVYSFAPDGVLDGEWADGTATEQLNLYAAASGAVPKQGLYRVEGRNSDGSRYTGQMALEGDGSEYRLNWTIGDTRYAGSGRFDNGLMIVDWGGATPLAYVLAADGRLVGLWDGGMAAETATPQ
ncbi:caspase family protein [Pseudomonas anguilliseptica]|uniref:caspase family protein n=1 Tax=Pseudomonas anguilliseptica TaxID=53406 RepID=UPI0022AEDA47|nr:caspase family protein [Pseudomonas anguilliseptica]MCZ4322612.1 caspase family protein [Pseudomonas anguilliseptica]